jgi:hypothetical protein
MSPVAYRGGLGGSNSEVLQSWTGLKIEQKMLCSYSNILISLKIAEFRRQHLKMFGKKAVKFYNYRFVIVLH